MFGLHFLAGGDGDETSLYVNFGEPGEYVKRTAEHFDLAPDSIEFLELAPTAEQFAEEGMYTLFSSADVEQPSLISEVRETVETLQPDRVLIDPITEFRFLTSDEHQFRSQIMGLTDFLRSEGATVLMTSQVAEDLSDTDLRFMTDVIVDLNRTTDAWTVDVTKFRGPPVERGPHGYEVTEDGVEVWPRLVPSREPVDFPLETVSSGVPELDELLNGGLQRGTVTFFSGPTGAGKTTTSLQQNLRGFGDSDPVDYLTSIGRYLREQGVTTLVTNEVHQITGEFRVVEEAERCRTTFERATIDLPGAPPTLTVRANDLLSSVIRNLISNAVQHNDSDEPVVSIDLSESDGAAQVRVADNGPGVPEAIETEIFEDEVKGLESTGTGMGLYLVSTLVDMYGGDIWTAANEPRGSVFVVELPTVEAAD